MFKIVEAEATPRPTPGEVLLGSGYADLALPYIHKDVETHPDNPIAMGNLGVCYKYLGEYEKAEQCLTKAIEMAPNIPVPLHNLGLVYEEIGGFNLALKCFAQASMMRRSPDTLYGLGTNMLRMGMFQEAFPIWEEARREKRSFIYVPNIPVWKGEDLHGKTILVLREGGYGDIFWLMRYLPLLKERGARIAFHVFRSQKKLLEGHPWIDMLLDSDDELEQKIFDYQIPLWSIMFLVNKVPLGMTAPYLWAEPKEHLKRPVVGFMPQAGEMMSVHRKLRSIQDEYLGILADVPVTWVNLQMGKKIDFCKASLNGCPEGWKSTAELMAECDLVVSSDSSVAHLAGAMGLETIVFCPRGYDWKFSHAAFPKNAWYPTWHVIENEDAVSFESAARKVRTEILHRLEVGKL